MCMNYYYSDHFNVFKCMATSYYYATYGILLQCKEEAKKGETIQYKPWWHTNMRFSQYYNEMILLNNGWYQYSQSNYTYWNKICLQFTSICLNFAIKHNIITNMSFSIILLPFSIKRIRKYQISKISAKIKVMQIF